jgi:hypothetical protein
MQPFDWRPVGDPDPKRFAEARTQLRSAAQWLARVQRSFAATEDASLNLSEDSGVISTGHFASDIGMELQIADLSMQFTEGGEASSHEIDVEERSPAHVEAWILIELLHRGLDRDRFSKDLPYDTSSLMNGDAVEFSPGAYEQELRDLGTWYRNAAAAIRSVAQAEGAGAEPRLSPLDLRLEAKINGRAIGFSPGDAETTEPFFYIAAGDARGAPRSILRASELPAETAGDRVMAFFAEGAPPTRH